MALDRNYSNYAWCVERAASLNLIDNTDLAVGETVAAVERILEDTTQTAT